MYADGLADNYDPIGAANTALNSAKLYSDSLAKNYDAAGKSAQALSDAKTYTDSQIAAFVALTPDEIAMICV